MKLKNALLYMGLTFMMPGMAMGQKAKKATKYDANANWQTVTRNGDFNAVDTNWGHNTGKAYSDSLIARNWLDPNLKFNDYGLDSIGLKTDIVLDKERNKYVKKHQYRLYYSHLDAGYSSHYMLTIFDGMHFDGISFLPDNREGRADYSDSVVARRLTVDRQSPIDSNLTREMQLRWISSRPTQTWSRIQDIDANGQSITSAYEPVLDHPVILQQDTAADATDYILNLAQITGSGDWPLDGVYENITHLEALINEQFFNSPDSDPYKADKPKAP